MNKVHPILIPHFIVPCIIFLQLAVCFAVVSGDGPRAAPYFTDVRPINEKVYINEGQNQEFRFNASDADGDPLTYEFVLSGKVVASGKGNSGNYTFKTVFLYSQGNDHSKSPYLLNLNLTDGTGKARYDWIITVNNTNREPVVKIDSPTDGAIYNISDNIHFNAASTTDLDTDDTLVFVWDFGDGKNAKSKTVQYTYSSPGTYVVKLNVSDGTVTKSQSITLTIKAAILKITGPVCDPVTPREGKIVKFKTKIQNSGEVAAKNVKVSFYIDTKTNDRKVDEKVIPSIGPGQSVDLNATWVAEKGTHSVIVVLVKDKGFNFTGTNELSQSLTVKAKSQTAQGLSLTTISLTAATVIGGILGILKLSFKFWKKVLK